MQSLRKFRFISIFWLLSLLTATSGVSIHQIYCYCLGETTVSLFDTGEVECGAVEQMACCAKAAPTCCELEKASTAQDGCQQTDCQHRTVKVAKLKTDIDFQFTMLPKLMLVAEAPNTPVFEAWTYRLFPECSHPVKAPPPKPTGRQISLQHQQFRC